MTVSHIYYDTNIHDASVNYQYHQKNGANIEYDVKDPGFITLMQTIALGTKATFSYTPEVEEM